MMYRMLYRPRNLRNIIKQFKRNYHDVEQFIDRLQKENYKHKDLLAIYATLFKKHDKAIELVNSGANPNYVALCAAPLGYKVLLSAMLEKGVTVHQTLAEKASENGHEEIVSICAHYCPDLDYKSILDKWKKNIELLTLIDSLPEQSHQEIANWAATTNKRYIVGHLLRKGKIDVNLVAAHAAGAGNKYLLQELIELGANNYNLIAFHAAYSGQEDIVKDMLDRGANNLDDLKIIRDIVSLEIE